MLKTYKSKVIEILEGPIDLDNPPPFPRHDEARLHKGPLPSASFAREHAAIKVSRIYNYIDVTDDGNGTNFDSSRYALYIDSPFPIKSY
jgi:hypothetical protein